MDTITNISITAIVAGSNDRTQFPANVLQELAQSIREHGLIQPITVRKLECDDIYQIVAGERRFRACQLLQWDTIPAIVKDLTDEEAAAVMLAENVSRQDLDPIDEALAYSNRMNNYGWTIKMIAEKAGVSTTRIQFRLKLLSIRQDLQALIRSGDLLLGYAQILSSAGLDNNFQLLAATKLRDNPHPTPGWFRTIVSELLEKQAQTSMFGDALLSPFLADCPTAEPIVEPAHPSTTKPPKNGKTINEILDNQASFWNTAAEAWNRIGKPFKRQECQAAAMALQAVLMGM